MTEDVISLTLVFDAKLTRAALRLPFGAGPKHPLWQRLKIDIAGGALIGALIVAALPSVFGLGALTYVPAFLIGALAVLIPWRVGSDRAMTRAINSLAALNANEGPTQATFRASGIDLASPNAQSYVKWPFITAIDPLPGGTVVLLGSSRLVVPDHCLPAGLDKSMFRAKLTNWQKNHA